MEDAQMQDFDPQKLEGFYNCDQCKCKFEAGPQTFIGQLGGHQTCSQWAHIDHLCGTCYDLHLTRRLAE